MSDSNRDEAEKITRDVRETEFRVLAFYALGLLKEDHRERFRGLTSRILERRQHDRFIPVECRRLWNLRREKVGWVLDRLGFLLDSDLPVHVVEHLLASGVLEVTTLGSQSWCLRIKALEWSGRITNSPSRPTFLEAVRSLGLRSRCMAEFRRFVPMLEIRYPGVVPENVAGDQTHSGGTKPAFTFFEQLTFRYSYFLHRIYGEGEYEDWFEGILKRYRWHFEKMALSEGTFLGNGHRERLLRCLSEELTGDPQRGSLQDPFLPLRKRGNSPVSVEENQSLEAIIEGVLGRFSGEELALLESKDSRGNPWSFGDQMRDRFRCRRSSFASMEEIGEHVARKVSMYRPLINGETAAVIGDILLDDFDGELFVSEATHRWNREMENSKELEVRSIGAGIKWAVDRILESVDGGPLEKLSLDIGDVKTLLLSRWKRARLAGGRRNFRRHLANLHLYTIHCPKYWSKETLSRVDLQAFLGQLDPLFLYPREGRLVKFLGSRNDEGLMIGWRGRFKDYYFGGEDSDDDYSGRS